MGSEPIVESTVSLMICGVRKLKITEIRLARSAQIKKRRLPFENSDIREKVVRFFTE